MRWQSYRFFFGLLSSVFAAQSDLELLSPSGNLKLTFSLNAGRPTYSLALDNQLVIAPSGMGLELFNRSDPTGPLDSFYDGFEFNEGGDEPSVQHFPEFNEIWYPYWGEESEIVDNHNEMIVRLVQPVEERSMNIRFRMFDTGVGFRYEIPAQPNLTYYHVSDEKTQFVMTGDHMAWWITGDYDTEEYNYMHTRIGQIRAKFEESYEDNASQFPFKGGVQTAFQMKTDNGIYINIHEAAVVNYSAMHLEIDDTGLIFESHLTPDSQNVKARLQAPNNSPWRTIIASKDVLDVLRSRITYNLNEPPTGDFSWVKPMKFMGVWWEMITGHRTWDYTHDLPSVQLGITDYSKVKPHGNHGANNGNVKNYIDFAALHGFDALLVEGWNIGWEDWFGNGKDYVFDFLTPYPDFDVEGIRKYAADKGLQIIMHHETSGSTRNYERHIDRAYQFMIDHGYSSVKSGYVGNILPRGQHHYSQPIVDHYNFAVKKAVEYKICVDAHEAVRPTGLARTYPNMIANEAARGQEYQAFSGSPPSHVVILPFTRQIGGPMDYTPGIFRHDLYNWVNDGDNGHNDTWRVQSTITQQIALYVTMYSPLQMAADTYYNYQPHVNRAFQFVKDVPVDWHKTVYIEGEPGEYLTIARLDKANKRDWFIGSIYGGTQDGRTSEFALDFLDDATCYEATLYHDTPKTHYWNNPHAYDIAKRVVRKGDPVSQWVAPGGGYAIKLEKLDTCGASTSTPATTASSANSMLGISLVAIAMTHYFI